MHGVVTFVFCYSTVGVSKFQRSREFYLLRQKLGDEHFGCISLSNSVLSHLESCHLVNRVGDICLAAFLIWEYHLGPLAESLPVQTKIFYYPREDEDTRHRVNIPESHNTKLISKHWATVKRANRVWKSQLCKSTSSFPSLPDLISGGEPLRDNREYICIKIVL